MVRKCCRVVTFAHLHVTGTENQIICTPAIQWLMKVYVNGLLIYNVPHLLSLSVYKSRFSVDRKWLRTAAQLLWCRIWQHSSEMWISCMVSILWWDEIKYVCCFVMYHMHTPPWYTNELSTSAGNGEKVLQCRYICIFACKWHWKSDNVHACHSVSDESLREQTAGL